MDTIKYQLADSQIPTSWYNLAADLPVLSPPLHPGTGQPATVEDLVGIMPKELAEQELTLERDIEIPSVVRQIYAQWRPAPLFRARRLEKLLDTPARIYYKYEGGSPAGSHKPNTGIAQAFYNKEAGIRRLATETGAGQWGSSLSLAGAFFGLEVKVFMVKVSYHQKPYRRALMHAYGATCVPSPSTETAAGRGILADDPDCPGSLGIATSEAIEVAMNDPFTNYAGGSVLNHVALHQTVIGKEALLQLEMADDYPDIIIGAAGGGSNLAGLAFPFLGEQLRGGRRVRVIAAEPSACPSLTQGRVAYDFGDTTGLTPLLKMHTLGHSFVPPAIHAGGLRYHGIAPLVSQALEDGLLEARAVPQTSCFEAGVTFARTEGIVPAPESTHAIRVAIDEALRLKEEGRSEAILFGLSGHGHFDLSAYEKYLGGELVDEGFDQELVARSLARLPEQFGSGSTGTQATGS
ncbi:MULTISPECIES: TrpB-like pyridoxal phosphate-dependent enzyme [unclassified Streptomyces]|uniref:TrpB-like pyridoxal phosphate-dependent enzyme n=1 Tax=Streptomycetaceae TaxID=2062 RepID=UPI002E75D123|nr:MULTISPECIES: TrpB-like pyridoxal phosphate-dependent enzyme [unclassified Streptomyces]MED7948963.1 TrpB-like pyridoxal phosphate-dependent enzyme [Streptomyces sp. BE303]MEE1825268.1 TrpB-like pyridoxal phosphate-dependent enzyme [Streptomyces sp. BE20]